MLKAFITKPVFMGVVRHVLTTAGGALVAKGSVSASDMEVIIGAVMTLAGLAFSMMKNKDIL